MHEQVEIDWTAIREKAGPYPPEAFIFVQQGLRHTIERIRRDEPELSSEGRHVNGRELCLGLRDYALDQYGFLARIVFERWSIRRTEDFGRIVFALVEAGLMRKTEEDTLTDFQGVFEFDEAFAEVQVG